MEAVIDEYAERGFDDEEAEVMAEKLAFEEWSQKRDSVQEGIRIDMKMYEERLRQLLAQYPDDADEELLETAGVLLRRLDKVGLIGRFHEDVEVERVAVRLAGLCSSTDEERVDKS